MPPIAHAPLRIIGIDSKQPHTILKQTDLTAEVLLSDLAASINLQKPLAISSSTFAWDHTQSYCYDPSTRKNSITFDCVALMPGTSLCSHGAIDPLSVDSKTKKLELYDFYCKILIKETIGSNPALGSIQVSIGQNSQENSTNGSDDDDDTLHLTSSIELIAGDYVPHSDPLVPYCSPILTQSTPVLDPAIPHDAPLFTLQNFALDTHGARLIGVVDLDLSHTRSEGGLYHIPPLMYQIVFPASDLLIGDVTIHHDCEFFSHTIPQPEILRPDDEDDGDTPSLRHVTIVTQHIPLETAYTLATKVECPIYFHVLPNTIRNVQTQFHIQHYNHYNGITLPTVTMTTSLISHTIAITPPTEFTIPSRISLNPFPSSGNGIPPIEKQLLECYHNTIDKPFTHPLFPRITIPTTPTATPIPPNFYLFYKTNNLIRLDLTFTGYSPVETVPAFEFTVDYYLAFPSITVEKGQGSTPDRGIVTLTPSKWDDRTIYQGDSTLNNDNCSFFKLQSISTSANSRRTRIFFYNPSVRLLHDFKRIYTCHLYFPQPMLLTNTNTVTQIELYHRLAYSYHTQFPYGHHYLLDPTNPLPDTVPSESLPGPPPPPPVLPYPSSTQPYTLHIIPITIPHIFSPHISLTYMARDPITFQVKQFPQFTEAGMLNELKLTFHDIAIEKGDIIRLNTDYNHILHAFLPYMNTKSGKFCMEMLSPESTVTHPETGVTHHLPPQYATDSFAEYQLDGTILMLKSVTYTPGTNLLREFSCYLSFSYIPTGDGGTPPGAGVTPMTPYAIYSPITPTKTHGKYIISDPFHDCNHPPEPIPATAPHPITAGQGAQVDMNHNAVVPFFMDHLQSASPHLKLSPVTRRGTGVVPYATPFTPGETQVPGVHSMLNYLNTSPLMYGYLRAIDLPCRGNDPGNNILPLTKFEVVIRMSPLVSTSTLDLTTFRFDDYAFELQIHNIQRHLPLKKDDIQCHIYTLNSDATDFTVMDPNTATWLPPIPSELIQTAYSNRTVLYSPAFPPLFIPPSVRFHDHDTLHIRPTKELFEYLYTSINTDAPQAPPRERRIYNHLRCTIKPSTLHWPNICDLSDIHLYTPSRLYQHHPGFAGMDSTNTTLTYLRMNSTEYPYTIHPVLYKAVARLHSPLQHPAFVTRSIQTFTHTMLGRRQGTLDISFRDFANTWSIGTLVDLHVRVPAFLPPHPIYCISPRGDLKFFPNSFNADVEHDLEPDRDQLFLTIPYEPDEYKETVPILRFRVTDVASREPRLSCTGPILFTDGFQTHLEDIINRVYVDGKPVLRRRRAQIVSAPRPHSITLYTDDFFLGHPVDFRISVSRFDQSFSRVIHRSHLLFAQDSTPIEFDCDDEVVGMVQTITKSKSTYFNNQPHSLFTMHIWQRGLEADPRDPDVNQPIQASIHTTLGSKWFPDLEVDVFPSPEDITFLQDHRYLIALNQTQPVDNSDHSSVIINTDDTSEAVDVEQDAPNADIIRQIQSQQTIDIFSDAEDDDDGDGESTDNPKPLPPPDYQLIKEQELGRFCRFTATPRNAEGYEFAHPFRTSYQALYAAYDANNPTSPYAHYDQIPIIQLHTPEFYIYSYQNNSQYDHLPYREFYLAAYSNFTATTHARIVFPFIFDVCEATVCPGYLHFFSHKKNSPTEPYNPYMWELHRETKSDPQFHDPEVLRQPCHFYCYAYSTNDYNYNHNTTIASHNLLNPGMADTYRAEPTTIHTPDIIAGDDSLQSPYLDDPTYQISSALRLHQHHPSTQPVNDGWYLYKHMHLPVLNRATNAKDYATLPLSQPFRWYALNLSHLNPHRAFDYLNAFPLDDEDTRDGIRHHFPFLPQFPSSVMALAVFEVLRPEPISHLVPQVKVTFRNNVKSIHFYTPPAVKRMFTTDYFGINPDPNAGESYVPTHEYYCKFGKFSVTPAFGSADFGSIPPILTIDIDPEHRQKAVLKCFVLVSVALNKKDPINPQNGLVTPIPNVDYFASDMYLLFQPYSGQGSAEGSIQSSLPMASMGGAIATVTHGAEVGDTHDTTGRSHSPGNLYPSNDDKRPDSPDSPHPDEAGAGATPTRFGPNALYFESVLSTIYPPDPEQIIITATLQPNEHEMVIDLYFPYVWHNITIAFNQANIAHVTSSCYDIYKEHHPILWYPTHAIITPLSLFTELSCTLTLASVTSPKSDVVISLPQSYRSVIKYPYIPKWSLIFDTFYHHERIRILAPPYTTRIGDLLVLAYPGRIYMVENSHELAQCADLSTVDPTAHHPGYTLLVYRFLRDCLQSAAYEIHIYRASIGPTFKVDGEERKGTHHPYSPPQSSMSSLSSLVDGENNLSPLFGSIGPEGLNDATHPYYGNNDGHPTTNAHNTSNGNDLNTLHLGEDDEITPFPIRLYFQGEHVLSFLPLGLIPDEDSSDDPNGGGDGAPPTPHMVASIDSAIIAPPTTPLPVSNDRPSSLAHGEKFHQLRFQQMNAVAVDSSASASPLSLPQSQPNPNLLIMRGQIPPISMQRPGELNFYDDIGVPDDGNPNNPYLRDMSLNASGQYNRNRDQNPSQQERQDLHSYIAFPFRPYMYPSSLQKTPLPQPQHATGAIVHGPPTYEELAFYRQLGTSFYLQNNMDILHQTARILDKDVDHTWAIAKRENIRGSTESSNPLPGHLTKFDHSLVYTTRDRAKGTPVLYITPFEDDNESVIQSTQAAHTTQRIIRHKRRKERRMRKRYESVEPSLFYMSPSALTTGAQNTHTILSSPLDISAPGVTPLRSEYSSPAQQSNHHSAGGHPPLQHPWVNGDKDTMESGFAALAYEKHQHESPSSHFSIQSHIPTKEASVSLTVSFEMAYKHFYIDYEIQSRQTIGGLRLRSDLYLILLEPRFDDVCYIKKQTFHPDLMLFADNDDKLYYEQFQYINETISHQFSRDTDYILNIDLPIIYVNPTPIENTKLIEEQEEPVEFHWPLATVVIRCVFGPLQYRSYRQPVNSAIFNQFNQFVYSAHPNIPIHPLHDLIASTKPIAAFPGSNEHFTRPKPPDENERNQMQKRPEYVRLPQETIEQLEAEIVCQVPPHLVEYKQYSFDEFTTFYFILRADRYFSRKQMAFIERLLYRRHFLPSTYHSQLCSVADDNLCLVDRGRKRDPDTYRPLQPVYQRLSDGTYTDANYRDDYDNTQQEICEPRECLVLQGRQYSMENIRTLMLHSQDRVLVLGNYYLKVTFAIEARRVPACIHNISSSLRYTMYDIADFVIAPGVIPKDFVVFSSDSTMSPYVHPDPAFIPTAAAASDSQPFQGVSTNEVSPSHWQQQQDQHLIEQRKEAYQHAGTDIPSTRDGYPQRHSTQSQPHQTSHKQGSSLVDPHNPTSCTYNHEYSDTPQPPHMALGEDAVDSENNEPAQSFLPQAELDRFGNQFINIRHPYHMAIIDEICRFPSHCGCPCPMGCFDGEYCSSNLDCLSRFCDVINHRCIPAQFRTTSPNRQDSSLLPFSDSQQSIPGVAGKPEPSPFRATAYPSGSAPSNSPVGTRKIQQQPQHKPSNNDDEGILLSILTFLDSLFSLFQDDLPPQSLSPQAPTMTTIEQPSSESPSKDETETDEHDKVHSYHNPAVKPSPVQPQQVYPRPSSSKRNLCRPRFY